MDHDLLEPIQRCPVCSAAIAGDHEHACCASCGAAVDASTIVIRGRRPVGWPAWMVLPIWSIPLGVAMAAQSHDLMIFVTGLFILHALIIAGRALWRAAVQIETVIVTNEGLGRISPMGGLTVRPYHLFDEVRIRLLAEPAGDAGHSPQWRLTIINAYKPSISIYLHSRGTDAPIFCSAEDVIITGEKAEVSALQALLQTRIDNARAAYRATRIRELDQLAIAGRRFRLRVTCPQCGTTVGGEAASERCHACNAFVCFSPDLPRFVLNASPVSWSPIPGLISIAIAMASLWPLLQAKWGYALASLASAAFFACLGYWLNAGRGGGSSRQWLVTPDGLESWHDGQREQELTWHDLPTLRVVQLERGSWRMAFWQERGLRVTFSPFLFTWFSSPAARPMFDAVLADLDLTGRLICNEVSARHAAAVGRGHELEVPTGYEREGTGPVW